ncbi:hypothetical protein IQ07DRAFT_662896 [Pyrenochaeta sp. DS3sAY3a]|nr:hypothetical protein IQ07DRAFT_662896 [Pyrenochaeta sp. DS3sAY3a]
MDRYDKIPAILHSTLQNWEIPIRTPSSILPDFLLPHLDPTSWPYELHYALYTLSGLTFRNKERAWCLLETYHTARLREVRQKFGNACENTALQVRDVEEACKSARKMLPGWQMQEALGRKPGQGEWQRGMPRRTESSVFDLPGIMEMGVGLGMQLDMPVDVSTQMEMPATTQCDVITNAEIDLAFELELQKFRQDSVVSVCEDGDKTPVPGPASFPVQAQTSTSPSPSLSFLDTDPGATPRASFISSEPFSPLSIFSLSDFSTSPITPATYTATPEQLPTDSRPVLPQLITQDLPTIYEAGETEEMDALRLEFERLEKEYEDARSKYWGAMGRSGDV